MHTKCLGICFVQPWGNGWEGETKKKDGYGDGPRAERDVSTSSKEKKYLSKTSHKVGSQINNTETMSMQKNSPEDIQAWLSKQQSHSISSFIPTPSVLPHETQVFHNAVRPGIITAQWKSLLQ